MIRDMRARQLGELSFLGTTIITALEDVDEFSFSESSASNSRDRYTALAQLLAASLENILGGHAVELTIATSTASMSLQRVLQVTLPSHSAKHRNLFTVHQRPGRWARSWPHLLLFPPLILLTMRSAYQNRSSIYTTIIDAGHTIRSFWTERVIEPVRDILKTVKTSGDEGAARVISRDGLKSDMEVGAVVNSITLGLRAFR